MDSSASKSDYGREFTFKSWQFDVKSGALKLQYANSEFGDFIEQFSFPKPDSNRCQQHKAQLDQAFNCLHWMAGISYYKTSLAKNIKFCEQSPNTDQADWLTQSWQHGLAELAFENQLPWLDHIQFTADVERVDGTDGKHTTNTKLSARTLVAIGGGKDSLVSIEAIKAMGEDASLFVVGQSEFIQSVAAETDLPLLQIKRQVDKKLKKVNEQGAFNGHIPITAINACVGVVAALLYDFDAVIFSNERSADVGNLKLDSGQWVNHQYSKSLAYEQTWQQIIKQNISADLHCFSLLRPFSELAIVKKFSALKQYFPHFSSCNRNFHLTGSQNTQHHWCGQCPKCAFVFLCMAPFISKDELLKIFKKDLFDDDKLCDLFNSLLGIQGTKPFECVGEQQECRLAVQLLNKHPEWQHHHQVIQWLQVLPKMDDQQINAIMRPSKQHLIPAKRNFNQVLSGEN